jgi:hypothetical protein
MIKKEYRNITTVLYKMNETGRITPSSIAELEYISDTIDDITIVDDITIENIFIYAEEGLEYLKEQLSKSSITGSDSLTYFYNYVPSSNDNILLKQLFCLSLCMLCNKKDVLNNISEGTYNKMLTYTTNKYTEKRILID